MTFRQTRHACAKAYAKMHHVIMVLKGSHTIVTDGTDEYINDTGNHGMATAGSGDVLTGIIGGFLAQHMVPFEAARLGSMCMDWREMMQKRNGGPIP